MPVPDADDVAALVAESRAAGRADAAARLRELWRDAYLEAAAAPPVPPPAPAPAPVPSEGSAWWVYCVVAAADAGLVPPDVAGVAPGSPVEIVTSGHLAAVVSPVPLAEFNDERLREHLEDLAWVEQVARAHEAALEAVMGATTIVPLRLCTICLTHERVGALLDEQASELASALDALRGRAEWGLKLFGPPARNAEAAPAAEQDDGRTYLERKRRVRADREEAQREVTERAQRLHDALGAEAVASAVNPPQRPEAHGRDAEMLLNSAYLVEDARRDRLRAVVDELAGEYEAHGFAVELTGPWPPYNFVSPATPALS